MRGKSRMAGRGLLVPAMVVGLALTAGPAQAQSGGGQHGLAPAVAGRSSLDGDQVSVTYVVRADIDGHSRLTLWGSSARWFHMTFAAPGRHNGKNNPTIINGTKWFPAWPQPGENRNCDCYSSTFKSVVPPVPEEADAFSFKALRCRDSCSARYSDGTLGIYFNDDPSPSDAWYKVKVTLTFDNMTSLHATR